MPATADPGDLTTPPRGRRPEGRRVRAVVAGAVVLIALITVTLSGCMERVFFQPTSGPTPPPAEFPGSRSVWFHSADGTRLHGWFVPAADGADGAPSILHVHGNAGNIESHFWFTEYLPAAGFNLFIFDYRGYGQSAGSARRRRPLIEDTSAALDALLEQPEVEAARVGMYGQSLGGGIGLVVMAERREIRAAVIESAFDSWRRIAANALGGDPPNLFGRTVAAWLIRDGDRPVDAIARIDRPVLILHGTADSIVPVSHGEHLADAAPNARLALFEGADHNTLRSTNPEVEAMVIEFLKKRLSD